MSLLAAPLLELARGVVARVWPDPAQQAEAQTRLAQLAQNGQLEELRLQLSAILAEANSADPYTSRARPTFLYVMYALIVLLTVGAVVGIWWPSEVFAASENLRRLLAALPEQLWWLFGTGYLGYTGARTFEKAKGAGK